MLKMLRRWLAKDAHSERSPAAAHPQRFAPASSVDSAAPLGAKPAAARQSERELEILDSPKAAPERPKDGFDPYNTGAFNRSVSWEKISKRHKR